MQAEATDILNKLKELVTNSRDQSILVMDEFVKLLPKEEEKEEEDEVENSTDEITSALTKMKLSQFTKLRKYNKGENFSRFTERFKEYIYITGMKDKRLYLYLLQNVDDATYSILKSVDLNPEQMEDAELFCDEYKKAIYGDQTVPLKSEVMDCKQQSDEDIQTYAFRLREKGNIAFNDKELMDEACFLTFIRGVKDTYICRKLNEGNVKNFEEALKLAIRLEKVENMLQDKTEVSSILKETTESFRPSRNSRPDYERTKSSSRDRQGSPSSHSFYQGNSNHYDRRRSHSQESDRSNNRYRSLSRDKNRSHFRDRSRSRENYPFSQRARNRQQDKTCYFCHKRGHIKRNCRKLRQFLNRRPPTNDGQRGNYTHNRNFQFESSINRSQPVRTANRSQFSQEPAYQSDFTNRSDLN